jgi:hypothetical protein
MRPKLFVLTAALGLAAGFAGHWLAGRPGVEAHVGARSATGERWEYCVVTRAQYAGSVRGGQYWIGYFRGNNIRTELVEAGVTEVGLAKAIAKLGEDGWEMVGEGPLDTGPARTTSTPQALYFKRPRE